MNHSAMINAIDNLAKLRVEHVKETMIMESVRHRIEECKPGSEDWRKARDKFRHTVERLGEIGTEMVLAEAEIEKLRYSSVP